MPTQNTLEKYLLLASGMWLVHKLCTYKRHDGHYSCLNHCMSSVTLQGLVKSITVLGSSVCYNRIGHFPIVITLKCDHVYIWNDVQEGQERKCKIAWFEITNCYECVNTMNLITNFLQTSMICDLCNMLTGFAKIAHIDWKSISCVLCLHICVFAPLTWPCIR